MSLNLGIVIISTSLEAGVIDSTLISSEEIQPSQENNLKKKRINKTKDIDTNLINEENNLSIDNSKSFSKESIGDDIAKEVNNKKQENKLININMNEHEEDVYSSMGFNPILILDEPPLYKNYTVNIIRPGIQEGEKEINKILEEDQQKNLDQSDTKNNNEDMIPLKVNNTIEKDQITSEEKEIQKGKILMFPLMKKQLI